MSRPRYRRGVHRLPLTERPLFQGLFVGSGAILACVCASMLLLVVPRLP